MSPSEKKALTKPAEASPSKPTQDLAVVGGVTSDGGGLNVVRLRDERIEVGSLRPLQEGKPIRGEVLRLSPRAEQPRLCDVDVIVPAPGGEKVADEGPPLEAKPAVARAHKGPAQVASSAYRENWDRIWAKGRKLGGPLN